MVSIANQNIGVIQITNLGLLWEIEFKESTPKYEPIIIPEIDKGNVLNLAAFIKLFISMKQYWFL